MRVGIFDSGIGGLTVLKELQKKYPNNEYFYYGDTLNTPYGDKSKEELFFLASKIIKYFEEKNVELIIVACGTISSTVYQDLQKLTTIPLYNVIDPVIEYINELPYKNILVLATTNTVNSRKFKNELKNNVKEVALPLLVNLIENGMSTKHVLKESLIDEFDADAVVLGCTHYPLIKEELKEVIKYPFDLIDMGKIFSERIDLGNDKKSLDLYFTKETDEHIINKILG